MMRCAIWYYLYNFKNTHGCFSLFLYCANGNKSRKTSHITPVNVRHDYFKKSFFPTILSDWYKLDLKIGNSASLSIFENNLPNFIRLCANSIFDIHSSYGIKLLIRLRPSFCYLHEHKFRHLFKMR